jgi:hypothetical protein
MGLFSLFQWVFHLLRIFRAGFPPLVDPEPLLRIPPNNLFKRPVVLAGIDLNIFFLITGPDKGQHLAELYPEPVPFTHAK